jgi:DNA polymerase sigma
MIVALQSRVPLVKITDERTRLCCDVSMENDLSLFKVEILFKTTSLEDVEH